MNTVPQPNHVATTAEDVGRTCPYCRFPFKAGVQAIACGSCAAMHHMECWQDNRGCAVMGCPSAPAPGALSSAPAGGAVPPPPPQAGAMAPAAAAAAAQPAAAGAPPAPPVSVPSAGEFAAQVQAWLRTPAVATIGAVALITVGVMLAVGYVVAILTPDRSFLGLAGADTGIFKEGLRDTVSMTMARYGSGGIEFTLLPLTFVLVPVAAAALGWRREARRVADLSNRARLVAGALTGVPVAIALLVLGAIGAGHGAGFSAITVVFYSLLWVGLGGVIGVAVSAGARGVAFRALALPAAVARWARLLWIAARPLLAVMVVAALVSMAVWAVQIVRGQGFAKSGRSQVVALVETPFFLGDYAVSGTGLATLAHYHAVYESEDQVGRVFPLPPDDHGQNSRFERTFSLRAYHGSYGIVGYAVLGIVLCGFAVAMAMYAGFATASAARPANPWLSVAYGALVGLVWALAMTILRAIADVQMVIGDSLFVSTLLFGAVGGAIGGAVAALRPRAPEPAAATS